MPKQEKRGQTAKHPRWPVLVGLLWVIAGPPLLFFVKDSTAGWAAIIAGLIFMAASRFEDIQEIALASFKMRLFERRVDEVEGSVQDIRRLAKESSRLALASIQFSGRLGGFTDDFKSQVLADTRRLLTDLNVTPEEIAEVESLWHAAIEFDYALWAMGLNTHPGDIPAPFSERFSQLRGGGVENRATPKDIRNFFLEADILTPERDEILEDYQHYVLTRQHRREDVWRQRHERRG